MQRRKRRQITGTSQTRSKNRDAVDWSESDKFVVSLNPSQALDYFFKVAVDITPYEKNLVKFCKSIYVFVRPNHVLTDRGRQTSSMRPPTTEFDQELLAARC